MFTGQFEHTIDEKGRITFPSRFRELLSDGAYLTLGLDMNLTIMPSNKFDEISAAISSMNTIDSKVRDLKSFLFGNAIKIEFDAAGRFVIPQYLREFAGIQNVVEVVGNNTNIDLFSPERWAEKQNKFKDPETLSKMFEGLNLSF